MITPRRRGELAAREVLGAELGDERRTARLEVIARQAATAAGMSLPKQSRTVAALEATYRFLNNEAVRPEDILEPHLGATASRARAAGGRVLVVHDTSECAFGERQQLGELNGKRKGFLAHVALAVTEAEHRPLGVLHEETIFREKLGGKSGKRKVVSERERWERGVDAVEQRLGDQSPVHVMDREGDAYELMRHMVDTGADFVIRAAYDRVLKDEQGRCLGEVLNDQKPVTTRTFPVRARARNPSPRHRKRHPPRDQRTAKATVSATTVTVLAPSGFPRGSVDLQLNVVRVREKSRGKDPSQVEWVLWTTLPVSTPEEVLAIVDIYRGRWVIEELFKALKTGCQYEKLQLESRRALTNALAVYLPVAWLLLHLRAESRSNPTAPATTVLSSVQLRCLRLAYLHQENRELPDALTARDALLAVARLGGHLKNNGEPGWLVIGRGLHDLLLLELGYILARRDAINP
jgi:hypothetical protein